VATTTAPSTTPPPPAAVSDAFSALAPAIDRRTGAATLRFRLPGPGTLNGLATAKVRRGKRTTTLEVGRFARNATAAGVLKLKLKPSVAALRELRRAGWLAVTVRVTFTPEGGSAKTKALHLTLRLHRTGKA
jgi:hypothetical protein